MAAIITTLENGTSEKMLYFEKIVSVMASAFCMMWVTFRINHKTTIKTMLWIMDTQYFKSAAVPFNFCRYLFLLDFSLQIGWFVRWHFSGKLCLACRLSL